ncbi:MAG: hypothetical protein DRP35_03320 [Candidatus Zixiibacteriota bacterium]|nr:MAG: hypothetical protein DRP35_03320 [candidate division Zixibacteria bacterium]
MNKKRIIYQNWISDIGHDPSKDFNSDLPDNLNFMELFGLNTGKLFNQKLIEKQKKIEKLKKTVKVALEKLSVNEREFIIHFYYMGKTYREISEKSNKEIYRLETVHKRALKKLKKELAGFVAQEYGLKTKLNNKCIICQSDFCNQINQIISNRDKKKTWKPVLEEIESKFSLKIKSPQILIGHEKYHINKF